MESNEPQINNQPRYQFRSYSRKLLAEPQNLDLHKKRLELALGMLGAEPAQGALADLFYQCGESLNEKMAALNVVKSRLNPFVAEQFENLKGAQPAETLSFLATRWSVFLQPSLDVPRRALRCSSDDSKLLARHAVKAWMEGNIAEQDEFLNHCIVCRDSLGFMMARRELLRIVEDLPSNWEKVGQLLEQSMVN